MRIFAVAVICLAFFGCLTAQSQLAFEVAAIKPAPRPSPASIQARTYCIGMKVDGARVQICGYSLLNLVSVGFRVPLQQVVIPDFARNEAFDVEAKLPEGSTKDQLPEMVQSMLAERFKLAYHREMREYSLNFLSVGKNGMKLPRLPDDTPPSSTRTTLPDGSLRTTQVGRITNLFPVMNSFGGLQLVDETGLGGIYSWVSYQKAPGPGTDFQGSLQEAFRDMIEAAGLKLETRKVSKETIVVDHVEKVPTEN